MQDLMNKDFIMFGASGGFNSLMDSFKSEDLSPNILYCCDNNKKLHGLANDYNYEIKAPKDILNDKDASIIISCTFFDSVYKQLRNIGVKNDIYVKRYFTPAIDNSNMKSYTKLHFNDILEMYENEDYTRGLLKLIYDNRTETKPFYNYDYVKGYEEVSDYFYDKNLLNLDKDITFYDVGTFDGKSVSDMIRLHGNRIKRIIAFEPDPNNFEVLTNYVESGNFEDTQVECVQVGLSDKSDILRFGGNDMFAKVDETGSNEIKVIALDDFKHIIYGELLIKMDIEGYELTALKGAINTIEQYRPYLAICVYHKTKDILEIPQFIRSIVPEYKFYLRGGTHTVLYAVPHE